MFFSFTLNHYLLISHQTTPFNFNSGPFDCWTARSSRRSHCMFLSFVLDDYLLIYYQTIPSTPLRASRKQERHTCYLRNTCACEERQDDRCGCHPKSTSISRFGDNICK